MYQIIPLRISSSFLLLTTKSYLTSILTFDHVDSSSRSGKEGSRLRYKHLFWSCFIVCWSWSFANVCQTSSSFWKTDAFTLSLCVKTTLIVGMSARGAFIRIIASCRLWTFNFLVSSWSRSKMSTKSAFKLMWVLDDLPTRSVECLQYLERTLAGQRSFIWWTRPHLLIVCRSWTSLLDFSYWTAWFSLLSWQTTLSKIIFKSTYCCLP